MKLLPVCTSCCVARFLTVHGAGVGDPWLRGIKWDLPWNKRRTWGASSQALETDLLNRKADRLVGKQDETSRILPTFPTHLHFFLSLLRFPLHHFLFPSPSHITGLFSLPKPLLHPFLSRFFIVPALEIFSVLLPLFWHQLFFLLDGSLLSTSSLYHHCPCCCGVIYCVLWLNNHLMRLNRDF